MFLSVRLRTSTGMWWDSSVWHTRTHTHTILLTITNNSIPLFNHVFLKLMSPSSPLLVKDKAFCRRPIHCQSLYHQMFPINPFTCELFPELLLWPSLFEIKLRKKYIYLQKSIIIKENIYFVFVWIANCQYHIIVLCKFNPCVPMFLIWLFKHQYPYKTH